MEIEPCALGKVERAGERSQPYDTVHETQTGKELKMEYQYCFMYSDKYKTEEECWRLSANVTP